MLKICLFSSNSEGDQQLQDDFDECKNFVDQLNKKFVNNSEEVDNKIKKMQENHSDLSKTVGMTNRQFEDNFEDVKNDIKSINDNYLKFKGAFDGFKTHEETINRRNVEEHEKIECTLQMLSESKNSIEKDIEHLKADVKANETSRKTQEKLQTDRTNLLGENQKSQLKSLTKVETELKTFEERMKFENKKVFDEFRRTEIRFQDTDGDIKLKMKSLKKEIGIDQTALHEQVVIFIILMK